MLQFSLSIHLLIFFDKSANLLQNKSPFKGLS